MFRTQLGSTMVIDFPKNCHALSLLSLLVLFCVSCTKVTVTESGEFEGLRIGMSKQEAFIALRERSDILEISAIVRKRVSIEVDNLEDISELSGSEQVIIRGPSSSVQVSFTGGYIDDIQESSIGEIKLPIETDMSMDDFLLAMQGVIEKNPRLRMYNTEKHHKWITLDRASYEDEKYLYSHDGWFAHEYDEPSTIRIFFDGGTLAKIVHKYFPVPWP